ncbi:unnamed protein product [Peronospora belbahrii]|uniref:PUB domain-containing protein n=1 Tax=Peronospora belbahrii TaxID=622444 RepID=A0AAU9L0L3_9STRA|nr:unnamed protein product [Peronospora belbahrii]
MKTCMLREIDAQVARVNPQGECSSSPEYVFVIRPRSPNHNEGEAARRQDLDHTTLDKDKVPVVHEVLHTYSQCRTLYRELQRLTDCTNVKACSCALGSCPFWSLFAVLGSLHFPKRTLFNRQSTSIFTQRMQALNTLIRTVLVVLRTTYRIHHFHNYNTPVGARACKVLVVLCRFLGLDNADVEQHLLESGERLLPAMKATFIDRKSMELRESLAIFKDEEKALTRIMSDDNEDQQRRSSVLLVSR